MRTLQSVGAVSLVWLAVSGCPSSVDHKADAGMLSSGEAMAGNAATEPTQDGQPTDTAPPDSGTQTETNHTGTPSTPETNTAEAQPSAAGAPASAAAPVSNAPQQPPMQAGAGGQCDHCMPVAGSGGTPATTVPATTPNKGTTVTAGAPADPPPPPAPLPTSVPELGKRLFEDKSLSASSSQACASCHEPTQAFTGSHDPDRPLFSVSRGAFPNLLGSRNAPTAMYMSYSPAFSFVQDGQEWTPTGGQFWDGRANNLSEQAQGPFINPREMALPDKAAVIERVRAAAYARAFDNLFGADALADVDAAYQHVADAIAAYEETDEFSPFSSKFDAVLRGTTSLTEQEALGLRLFQDETKGNCIACHAGKPESHDPHDWLFTDFTYDNLGVPRDNDVPDNSDPEHYDLGLCQSDVAIGRVPAATADPRAFLDAFCGAFKVPTLRNVAKTAPYMHNGHFKKLRDVVDFYVTRDTNPERWYARAQDGSVRKFDDIPERHIANVNTIEVPYDRQPGQEPRLSPAEIDAVVAFLETLTDGYQPPVNTAPPNP